MTNSKHTKRALLSSIVSLLLCFTMLMGATFAWFTDNVSSTGNRILAGDLEVDLVMDKPDASGNYDGVYDVISDGTNGDIFSEATGNGVRWEPGKTEIVYLGVQNSGNLALKYNIVLNIVDNGLAGALEYAIIDGATSADIYADWNDVKTNGQTGDLPTGQVVAAQGGVLDEIAYDATKTFETDYFALAIHMKEEAGNEYENKDVKIDVQVIATQKDAEEDSFGPDYDEDATYADVVVNDAASLKAAIASGEKLIGLNGTITLTESLGATGVTFVGTTKGAAIDFGTYGISGTGNTFKNLTLDNDRDGWYKGMQYSDGEKTTYINCTIANGVTTYGDSTFDGCTFEELPAGNYNLFIYDGKNITVKNSTFKYGNRAIKIYNEGGSKDISVSISDSTFLMSDTSVLNKALIEIDDTYMDSVKVDVKNITVDGGLKAQGIYRINDGTLDTSSAKSTVTVDGITNTVTPDTLNAAIQAAEGPNNVFVLSEGRYNNNIEFTVDAQGEAKGDIVFKAADGADVVFAGTTTLGLYERGTFNVAAWDGKVTFEGVTFDHAQPANHSIIVENVKGLTLKDCTIIGDGEYGIGSVSGVPNGEFSIDSCTFENAGIQVVGNFGTGLVIDDCDFNNSRINVQGGNSVTVKNCRFDATLTDANIGDSFYLVRSNSTPITVKDCTAKVDSTVSGVAAAQAKWGLFWNRGTTNWTVSDVDVTLTDAAKTQTELLVTKCTSSGAINTSNLNVN
ncbi:MAG: right-handed parallel beta-helix repeat-containing protein [Oscillospiraceae bacterium]|nr:right-handed parallel beta-helix repeat-containing protein [Oscillospiraceae bacterium]